jgi:hypothetical protein
MDESAATARDRVFAGGKSNPSPTAWQSAASPHRRPASQSGGQSQAARKKDAGGIGNYCHAGDIAALAPETHREQVRRQCASQTRRPATAKEIEALIVRMSTENRDWGYLRILGALSNLGHELARSTIANILKRNAIEPAPERVRKTTWKEFLIQHRDQIVAADFFTVEVWTRKGLRRFLVLFFLERKRTDRRYYAGTGSTYAPLPPPDRHAVAGPSVQHTIHRENSSAPSRSYDSRAPRHTRAKYPPPC